ncbi:MAG: DUF1553 domain-containing protein [Pirellulales bacterium]|nr:DUF1553 domain-containing protein [Pirellulales bacterium]
MKLLFEKRLVWSLCLSELLLSFFVSARAEEPVNFALQIAPIFEQHCVKCHGADNKKGDVSLATIEDLEENGFVIAGDPEGSYLLELVTASSDGAPPKMPKQSEPLSEDEIKMLRRWVAAGAEWPEEVVIKNKSKADESWWSLQPLAVADREKTIDDFLRFKLVEHGLDFNPQADRPTLIRRATYDLLGVPPTPEEVEDFVKDTDPHAYEKLIDQLLASPHYGERWGRHWLDVVRFGESAGYEVNAIIDNLWPFRDYIIQSINEDKPFNQLIREHIAGDLLGKDDPDVAVGSAFLVAGPYDSVDNQDPVQQAQIRANTIDEMIRATGEAFLGMTLGCARCHDHKFDPVTQQDYYGLYATFAGVRHDSVQLATSEVRAERAKKMEPLQERRRTLLKMQSVLRKEILQRAEKQRAKYELQWVRPAVDPTGTEEHFDPVVAKYVRLVCESQNVTIQEAAGFSIDEFEVWSVDQRTEHGGNAKVQRPQAGLAQNVALAANGGRATGDARKIEDFPEAYGPHLAIDGKRDARFIAAGTDLTIELARPTLIDRVVFSNVKPQEASKQIKFVFVAEYCIEVSVDGQTWREVANGRDRKPIDREGYVEQRLLQMESTAQEQGEQARLKEELGVVDREIAELPELPLVWIGRRVAADAEGPFHVFLGGNPQRKGAQVLPASLAVFGNGDEKSASRGPAGKGAPYRLSSDADEGERRTALANWLVGSASPLTLRVLANRLWHYHFGTGIVDTPSDFGYMGGNPVHPELLDFLAAELQKNGWCIKEMHRQIMTSEAYRQSSVFRTDAAQVDGDARFLWRFPPRRLSAEEIRDTMLQVSGKLDRVVFRQSGEREVGSSPGESCGASRDGGPGFRMYHYMRDNVSTYVPLDKHGPETYRRAVYHQNARAAVVDLMTDFDQPDCAFAVPKRVATTSPLQALTLLNHSFTLDMATALAKRLGKDAGDDLGGQLARLFQLCYGRVPTDREVGICREFVDAQGLVMLCRVLLNTNEMIYVR